MNTGSDSSIGHSFRAAEDTFDEDEIPRTGQVIVVVSSDHEKIRFQVLERLVTRTLTLIMFVILVYMALTPFGVQPIPVAYAVTPFAVIGVALTKGAFTPHGLGDAQGESPSVRNGA